MFQCSNRILHRARTRTHRTWHPVERAESVQDGSANTRNRISLKLGTIRWIKFVNCIHETKHASTHEVTCINRLWQSGCKTTRNELHKRCIVHNEPVTCGGFLRNVPCIPCSFNCVAKRTSVHARGCDSVYARRKRSLLTCVYRWVVAASL